MLTFKLTEDIISRLRAKFDEFQREREALNGLLIDYIADYRRFQGTTLARQEYLEEKYAGRAEKLSHLVWDENGEIYWNAPDIAILLGRRRASITRTLAKMEREDGWCARLLALRKSAKAANGLSVYVYHQDIFNLILDRYEEEYLLRFSEPRRGDPGKAPDIREIRRFWNYLKANARIQHEHFVQQEEQEEKEGLSELPELPKMGWRDILSLIWRKVFTIRTGMFFTVLFAASFELVRRWPGVLPFILALSSLVFVICAMLLHLRKGPPTSIATLGAEALLFTLLWGAGLLSSDGTIRAPGGEKIRLRAPEQTISLTPILSNEQVNFTITASDYNVREFLYRISPDVEYRSTGFTKQPDGNTDLPFPNLVIKNSQQRGDAELEVKCIDSTGKEQGPWTFLFNIDDERFNLRKKLILSMKEPWVTLRGFIYVTKDGETFPYMNGQFFVELDGSLMGFHAKKILSAVVYGFNTDQPETILPVEAIQDTTILTSTDERIQYVTSYLIFEDGTSSDIRRAEKNIIPISYE